jgi:hypothetical protein
VSEQQNVHSIAEKTSHFDAAFAASSCIQKEFHLAVNRYSLSSRLVPATGIEAQTSEPSLAEVRHDVEGALADNPCVTDRMDLAPRSLMKLPHLAADNLSK